MLGGSANESTSRRRAFCKTSGPRRPRRQSRSIDPLGGTPHRNSRSSCPTRNIIDHEATAVRRLHGRRIRRPPVRFTRFLRAVRNDARRDRDAAHAAAQLFARRRLAQPGIDQRRNPSAAALRSVSVDCRAGVTRSSLRLPRLDSRRPDHRTTPAPIAGGNAAFCIFMSMLRARTSIGPRSARGSRPTKRRSQKTCVKPRLPFSTPLAAGSNAPRATSRVSARDYIEGRSSKRHRFVRGRTHAYSRFHPAARRVVGARPNDAGDRPNLGETRSSCWGSLAANCWGVCRRHCLAENNSRCSRPRCANRRWRRDSRP